MANRVETKSVMIFGRQYVNTEECAKALGLSITYLREMARAGKIPVMKVGARWRYNVDEVFRAMDTNLQYDSVRATAIAKVVISSEDICDGI